MDETKLSESQEDYLKHIFKLGETRPKVTTQDLANSLKVKPASVTGMIKKLCKMELVTHRPYKGVALTPLGKKIALEVVRHHRLLELYLAEHLNYSWEEIHEEAERLEHVISEKFEAAISDLMGNPTHDPHGDPIPTVDLEFPDSPQLLALDQIKTGLKAAIRRVMSQDKDLLAMLGRLDMTIGRTLYIAESDKSGIRVRVNNHQFLIPRSIAKMVYVESISGS